MSEQAPVQDAESALVGRVLAERYRVERLLGSGGMGSVYRAEHVLMKKAVALKVLHREMTYHPEVVARFEREAIAAARIEHPNVAAAMDCGRLEDGSFYIVLEYVDGKSLRALLDEGPLEIGRSLGIAAQMADALVAAHAAGIVHRDLKPDNVMLVSQGGAQDFAKILDFGIAKVDGSDGAVESQRILTRIGAVMGTAGYMAPEQALGQAVDQRADLYAFGVVLYEMVAGRLPYVADEAAQILAKQLTEAPAPLPSGAPPALTNLIERLLEKSAEARLQTAKELAEAIAHIRGSLDASGPATVLDVDAGGLPKSARTSRSTDDSAATLDVADGQSRSAAARSARQRRGAVLAGVALLVILGAVFWGTRKSETAAAPFTLSSATAALLSSLPPLPAAVPSESAAPPDVPPAAAREEGPGTAPTASASTRTTFTESKSTKTDGHTTTTKRTSRRTTVTEKKTVERKRRTGPGGIYIPPPSQWFK